jgi:hypothetical protein
MNTSLATTVPTPDAFPFLFDIGGIQNASIILHPSVERVQFNKVFECPHPCGLMPHFDSTGRAINGGLPQLVNTSLHFQILNTTFAKYVPRDEDRLVDFDFEDWNPVWERNANTSKYQVTSRLLVQQVHPTWSSLQIEDKAKIDFEEAAKKLLIDTIAFIKKIRPSIKVGIYGFPTRYYYNGYDTGSGDVLRSQNDALFPLWCSLDALMPSVYQFYNSANNTNIHKNNANYVRTNVLEAVRIANEIPKHCNTARPPVWVYTWHRYHAAGEELLCDEDESMYWNESLAAGATGLILWGYEPKTADEFINYWETDFAPLINGWK